jgi:hypothetical protein
MRGRKKLTSSDGLSINQWLKAFLSGGRRQANEIIQAGELQGFGERTLRRAKAESGIDSEQEKRIWWWFDPSVPTPEKPKTFQEEILHKLDEVQRLTQTPSIVTKDGRTTAPDPNAVDAYGFKTTAPGPSLDATITPVKIHAEIKRLAKTDAPHEEVAAHIFKWAYPASGLSESVLAAMMRNGGVSVPSRPTSTATSAAVQF